MLKETCSRTIWVEDILGHNLDSLMGKTMQDPFNYTWQYAKWNAQRVWRCHCCHWYHAHKWNTFYDVNVMSNSFGHCRNEKNETKSTIIKSLQQIINRYHGRGFRNECVRKTMELQGKYTRITGRDEHVPEVERYMRMVKERARATVSTEPFEILPHWLIIENSLQCHILVKLLSTQGWHTPYT